MFICDGKNLPSLIFMKENHTENKALAKTILRNVQHENILHLAIFLSNQVRAF